MRDKNIRRAEIRDADMLPGIERSAGQAFRQIPDLAWVADDDDLSAEWHRRVIAQGTSWVAVDQQNDPVGFLNAEIFFDELHIWEISVLFERQRKGLGRGLIQRSIDDAKARGLAAITLTTFRSVVWNEPFYMRLGFITLKGKEVGRRLDALLQAEINRGMPVNKRCAMRLLTT